MTLIIRSLERDGTFAPCAINLLEEIPDSQLFLAGHQSRHPDSIYRRSLDKISNSFCEVAGEYFIRTEELTTASSSDQRRKALLTAQVSFLHVLQEHQDELWMILRTLIDPATAKTTSAFNKQYVLENKLPGSASFEQSVDGYRKDLRIVNKLKHQQCQLCDVTVRLPSGVHLGYCLEEPDRTGALGPSPDIHPDQGAFSFARDLTGHMANVYLSSERLAKAVMKVLDSRGIRIKPQAHGPESIHQLNRWDEVVKLLCKIPEAYFPKEMRKTLAKFSLDESGQTLSLKIPARLSHRMPTQVRVEYGFTVDRHTPLTRVPLP